MAEISRQEDVGLDAVASLLRRDDEHLYAEDTFVVQIKSDSVETVDYPEHAIKWLLSQTQPMFIGRVALKDSHIAMYPTLHIRQAVLACYAKQVKVRFGQSDLPPFIQGSGFLPWVCKPEWGAEVWLGEPLLTWDVADIANRNWHSMAYRVLKKYLAIANRERELNSLAQSSVIVYGTNDEASIRCLPGMLKVQPDDFNEHAERAIPYLTSLLLHSLGNSDDRRAVISPVLQLLSALRELGCDTDPQNALAPLLRFCELEGRADA